MKPLTENIIEESAIELLETLGWESAFVNRIKIQK